MNAEMHIHTFYHSHMSISIRQIEKLHSRKLYAHTFSLADLFILCPQKKLYVSSHDFGINIL